jgi:hypothetical protein
MSEASKDTGGAAYPEVPADCNSYEGRPGMTLRDYFAAKALQGLLACDSPDDWRDQQKREEDYPAYCDSWAESAYELADAMLKARSA